MIQLQEGQGVEVACPQCQAGLSFGADDVDQFREGDLVTCDTCGFAMTVKAGRAGLCLHMLGALTQCPHCQVKLAVSPELLNLLEHQAEGFEGASVTCPHCHGAIEVQFESLGGMA